MKTAIGYALLGRASFFDYTDRGIKVDMHTYLTDKGFVGIDCGYSQPGSKYLSI